MTIDIFTALVGDRWLAATGSAPYFCFEAATENEAVEKAYRALDFVADSSGAISRLTERHTGSIPVWQQKSQRELEPA